ncbi:Lysozyme [Magnetospirillum molischianum DSM 120]|uniref:Lysozyme n=2 Tax=Magnetospirillum molischianum TaxID=1083 RepID=H8FP82_MAGML|nr:Lysozyme [Magnetospirillum molischianum DSM 120]
MLDLTRLYADLRRDEGLRLVAYRCTAGVLTIGYGHTSGVCEGDTCTPEQAEAWLQNDVAAALTGLDHALPWWRRLAESRQRALANMAFQLGLARLLGFKRMLAALERGDYATAAAEALNSKWAREDTPERAHRVVRLIREGK